MYEHDSRINPGNRYKDIVLCRWKSGQISTKISHLGGRMSAHLFCKNVLFNPIRSGGGLLKPIFCPHAFNFGAALLCVGDFTQKIV